MQHASGAVARAHANLAALETLRRLDGQPPNARDRETLAAWCGWGPMADAFEYNPAGAWREVADSLNLLLTADGRDQARRALPNAFYTTPEVAGAIWSALTRLGFTGGRVLEPGCGHGAFIAAAPQGLPVDWTGVEADPTSAGIAAKLHPHAHIIQAGLQRTPLRPGGFDAVVGNVPFGEHAPYDPSDPAGHTLSLHNYVIRKALKALRPGGLLAVVTSRYTMDAGPGTRQPLADYAALVGAIRLPTTAFAGLGTRVLTDIVILRRRDGTETGGPAWADVETDPALDTPVNTYFLSHPERVVGTMRPKHGHAYGHTLDVVFDSDPSEFPAALNRAVNNLTSTVPACLRWQPPTDPTIAAAPAVEAVDGRKEGSFHPTPDGGMQRIVDGRARAVAKPTAELRALTGLRDVALTLLDAESDPDAPDADIAPHRAEANRVYDDYVARFGPLNRHRLVEGKPDPDTGEPTFTARRPAMGGFRADPDYVTVLAVEQYDTATGAAGKAPLLLRRVGARPRRPDRAGTPDEAVAYCLDEHGHLDLATVGGLLDIPESQVPAALGDRAYLDPETGLWVTAVEYLSGNVRTKLAAARKAAETDPDTFTRNVDVLTGAQPTDLGPAEIVARLGAPWVHPVDIERFLRDTLGKAARVAHGPATATWEMRVDGGLRNRAEARTTWGTERVDAYRLVEQALNGSAPVVTDKLDDGRQVRNQRETMLAEQKQQALQERFGQWLWEDPDRTERLCRVYNDRYNAVRLRGFDGSHLTFPGLVAGFEPYQSQLDMTWRIVSTPAALCGHAVGAGKTMIQFGSALTLRRLGLARKPAIIVPNHLLEQTCAEGRRLFPAARVLMVTREDLTPERRRAFAARVAAGDWDAVVMTHQAFTSIPVGTATQAGFVADEIQRVQRDTVDLAASGGRVVKRLEKQRAKLEADYEWLLDHSVDDGLVWEHLGVDYLMVDEAQAFKSLKVPTRQPGFSMPASQRAADLAMKLAWLRARNPTGRCGALFTGTPVSNSLVEVFVLLTYLTPGRLGEAGLDTFDAFAAQHIKWESKVEVAPDGSGFRAHRRPATFINVPEMRLLLAEVADIRTRDQLRLAGPAADRGTVITHLSEWQRGFVRDLVERADRVRSGGVDPRDDNMLTVCNDGRRVALDPELVGLPLDGWGKIDAVADQVADVWRRTCDQLYPDPTGGSLFSDTVGGLQIVFCDLGTPTGVSTQTYGRIRARLVDAGVPASKIRFVHHAGTDAEKAALFAACRAGDVSVLLGSTEKLGTGVNIQHRCVAVHHVDAPWRPADVEQREGRALRPGNPHNPVRIVRYVTEGSFDAYMWQALERKARFISQILTGGGTAREVEDIGEATLDYGEVKALATGQPLLLELAEVNADVVRLRNLATAHTREQRRIDEELRALRAAANRADADAADLDTVAVEVDDTRPGLRVITGQTITSRDALADALADAVTDAARHLGHRHIGCYRGVDLRAAVHSRGRETPEVELVLDTRHGRHNVAYPVRASWLAKGQRWRLADTVDHAVDHATQRAAELRGEATRLRDRAVEIKPLRGRPFQGDGELAAALARRDEIETKLAEQVTTPEPAGRGGRR